MLLLFFQFFFLLSFPMKFDTGTNQSKSTQPLCKSGGKYCENFTILLSMGILPSLLTISPFLHRSCSIFFFFFLILFFAVALYLLLINVCKCIDVDEQNNCIVQCTYLMRNTSLHHSALRHTTHNREYFEIE